jgi:adenylate kinase
VEQAKILSKYIEVHQVFHLSCPDRNELARRMRKRALRSNRIDDANEDVIQDRIRTYEAETKPIIDYYDDAIITDIDAAQEPIKVLNDIVSKIVSLPIYEEMKKVVL